jgi:hypothetical protein
MAISFMSNYIEKALHNFTIFEGLFFTILVEYEKNPKSTIIPKLYKELLEGTDHEIAIDYLTNLKGESQSQIMEALETVYNAFLDRYDIRRN